MSICKSPFPAPGRGTQICLSAALALAASMACALDIPASLDGAFVFSDSNSMTWAALALFVFFLLLAAAEYPSPVLRKQAVVVALLLALFSSAGYQVHVFHNFSGAFATLHSALCFLIKFLGTAIVCFSLIACGYALLDQTASHQSAGEAPKSSRRLFVLLWLLLLVVYLLYYAALYPGVFSPDAIEQIGEAIGLVPRSNHHPFFQTMLLIPLFSLGNTAERYRIGLTIYMLIQILLGTGLFTYVLIWSRKRGAPRLFTLAAFLYDLLYPIHAFYASTFWKDIPFSYAVLFLTLLLAEMSLDSAGFFSSKGKKIALSAAALLVMLFKKNGVYVIIPTFLLLLLWARGHRKETLNLFLIPFLGFLCWDHIALPLLGVTPSPQKEALSVPLQQLTRVMVEHKREVSETEQEQFLKYFSVTQLDTLRDAYQSTSSDPIKELFNEQAFTADRADFFRLWLRIGQRFPLTYLDSFLCNSYGYWYPEAKEWVMLYPDASYGNAVLDQKEYHLENQPLIPNGFISRVKITIEDRLIPVLSMCFSIAANVWLFFIAAGYLIAARGWKSVIAYAPVFFIWISCLLSPVFCEFRYIYGLFTSLPVLLLLCLLPIEKKS